MKTVYESKFEKHVISSISGKACSVLRRSELFLEFYKCGSLYYEELCESLFLLSSGEKRGNLFLTPAGKPYISLGAQNPDDYWTLNSCELPIFKDDLHDQLNIFMDRFSSMKKFFNDEEVS